MSCLTHLPEECLLLIFEFVEYNDFVNLEKTSKSISIIVRIPKEKSYQIQQRERNWNSLRNNFIKTGMRQTPLNIREQAFEKGVKEGFIIQSNQSFVDGQIIANKCANKLWKIFITNDNN